MRSSAKISYLFASLPLLALPIGCTLIAAPDPDQICASDAEVCGDGLDNDCDGQIDEDCVCTEGEEQACYSGPAGTKGIGICKEGTQKCESGAWGACVGAVLPGTEIVDGQDNDCDGEADEDINCLPNEPYPCYDGPSGTLGVGICKEGMQQKCVAMGACVGQVLPKAEICNGLDDDCNGTIDDGISKVGEVCMPNLPGACGAGQGLYVCQPDGLFCMPNVMPTTETCNAIDDDCDGVVDDGPFCCPDGVQNGDESDVDCGGSCITQCDKGQKCDSPTDCQTHICDPITKLCSQKDLGYPCVFASECASGFCVEGTCCDSACNGTCVACTVSQKGSGLDGTCGPIAANFDPDNECVDQGPASCGTTGVCDGAGACALYPPYTECSPASCFDASTLSKPDLCDGLGSCVDGGAMSCAPYTCQNGTCAVFDPVACTSPSQCASNYCVDYTCCNIACVGACKACTALKKGSGTDGTCGNIAANTDPDDECVDQGPASCGTTGVCDGAGSCALYPPGTVCSPASCIDATTLSKADVCNGFGSCLDGGTVNCAPYACQNGACLTTCASDADCISGTCTNGICQP